jgi:hypothetical protein
MCRVLHALEHGTIVSKPKAIQWARTQLSDTWIKLIAKAVAVSNHKDQDVSTEETLNFIKFIKEKTL